MSYSLIDFTRIKKRLRIIKKLTRHFTEVITHKTRKLEGLQTNNGE